MKILYLYNQNTTNLSINASIEGELGPLPQESSKEQSFDEIPSQIRTSIARKMRSSCVLHFLVRDLGQIFDEWQVFRSRDQGFLDLG